MNRSLLLKYNELVFCPICARQLVINPVRGTKACFDHGDFAITIDNQKIQWIPTNSSLELQVVGDCTFCGYSFKSVEDRDKHLELYAVECCSKCRNMPHCVKCNSDWCICSHPRGKQIARDPKYFGPNAKMDWSSDV